ncbi:hypothetical protein [Nocardia spumae]|uniref:hypothetical protein n=1 Tax=Nocardia spumae TaxID=2887190 RepID=UPI001D149D3D|nr:hypothetical protein [Nocardia spumae]
MKDSATAEKSFASRSIPVHLTRGVIGFGLLVASVALIPVIGPIALLLLPAGLVALRGCPTCWLIGLAQTVSRGRIERECVDGQCRIAARR